MPRPKVYRHTRFNPDIYYFKPRGVPLRELEEVILHPDELEALKLHDVDGFDHTDSAEKMKISQPTFGRILNNAYKKIAAAIITGKAIHIETKNETE